MPSKPHDALITSYDVAIQPPNFYPRSCVYQPHSVTCIARTVQQLTMFKTSQSAQFPYNWGNKKDKAYRS